MKMAGAAAPRKLAAGAPKVHLPIQNVNTMKDALCFQRRCDKLESPVL